MLLKTSKKGFVILYAVIITTVVLVIGVSLMNIVTKQLVLSSIGRNSKLAYYAAVSGKECAEYWKNIGNYFGEVAGSPGSYYIVDPDGEDKHKEIGCPYVLGTDDLAGQQIDFMPLIRTASERITTFRFQPAADLCSQVTVTVRPSDCRSERIQIQSEGYNDSCNALLAEDNPRRVKSVYSDLPPECPL